MPPKRSQSSRKSIEQEGRILLAIREIQSGTTASICEITERFQVPKTTLLHRISGQQFRADTRPNGHKMTETEEDSLTQWILSMDARGAAPWPATVREMANLLLAKRGSATALSIGPNWVSKIL